MFKRYWWMLFAMVPVGMMAGFLVAAVVTYVMPKQYESSTLIEIKPRTTTLAPDTREISTTGSIVCGVPFDKIKSRNSFLRVIEKLDLKKRWGMDEYASLQELKRIVRTENLRGTDLISITVRHSDRVDARDIAAEVAKVYVEYRTELVFKLAEKEIAEVKKAVRDQEDRVEERRNVLTTISRTGPLIYGESDTKLAQRRQDYLDAKRDFEADIALLEQMKLKLASLEISRNVKEDIFVVHGKPVIPDTPVSPDVTQYLIIGAILGFMISPFLALPLMWMMKRRNGRDGLSEPSGSV